MYKEHIPTEREEQITLIRYLELKKIPYFAIPNGGLRNKITAKKLKQEGVKAGIPDIFIPQPTNTYAGLFIELKRRKGGQVSIKQKEWIELLNKQGYLAVVAKGAGEAIKIIEKYIKDYKNEI